MKIRTNLGLATLMLAVVLGADAAMADTWKTPVTSVAAMAGQVVSVKGKIDGGKPLELAWAANSSVACFPATQNENFRGSHVFYGTSLPAKSRMTITLVPDDPKTDLSLYAFSIGTTDFKQIPPAVSSVVSCEASYDKVKGSNPGATESVMLNATTNPYNVVIGVAGAKGVKTGGFTLKIGLETAAAAPTTTLTATNVASKQNGAVSTKGKLEDGAVIDLAWAANSSMACWPATENVNFNGKHVLYRTSLPTSSNMTITATPTDAKTDLSVYAYMVADGDTKSVPPTVSSATTCEAGYDQKSDNNPGKPETAKLNSTTHAYTVYVGVAGANGASSGAFDLKIELKPK